MKTQLRLDSVVPNGVGGAEAIALDIIYGVLLDEFGQTFYSYISINQIGEDLNEFVMKESAKKIHVNIRYPAGENFGKKSNEEKNRIRTGIIHNALLRIADFDKKLNAVKLNEIRDKILERNFSFDFPGKTHFCKKNKSLTAKVIVHPGSNQFDYYVLIENNGKEKCRAHIFSGKPVSIYSYKNFFSTAKWKSENEFVLTGKDNEVETHVIVDQCKVEIVNLTRYDNPPHYTLMKPNISEAEREKAMKNWEHSLPPGIAAIIREANN